MVGNCTDCHNEAGVCSFCEDEFINNASIICYEEGQRHFCNEDCLVSWLKSNSRIKESSFEFKESEVDDD